MISRTETVGMFLMPGGYFLIEIPASLEELLTIRELHVVAEVTLLLKGFSLRTKSPRVGKNLRTNVTSQIGCFVNNTWGRSAQSSFRFGQCLGQTLVKLGQTSPNSGKCAPGLRPEVLLMWWVPIRSDRLGQTWSTLVKFGQTPANVPRTPS
uniref:Uncharacterized protein n=1 Tax=Fagus sylvatica TaxID=28930 RepID=A0A2N9EYS3_FAGSY